jgi:tRNA-2-methylthio-N6-dimethylallyladenosine synthase
MPNKLSKPAIEARVFLETFGCQMNLLDSELVEGQFREQGYRFVNNAEEANVVLLNTCSVRDLSEQKVLSRLGKLKERKENGEKLVVGVLGCMAERAHDELAKKRPFIDVIVGPSKIQDTLHLVHSALNNSSSVKTQKSLSYFVNRKGLNASSLLSPFDDLEALDQKRFLHPKNDVFKTYVRITRGCNKFCSFCVVPRTRGHEMHRPPQSIIDEVKQLVDNGAKEVTLLGQTINHYYFDNGKKTWSFADLLFQIHEQVPALNRLRFLTSYPRDFSDEALDVMKSCDRICKYLHIPAQSGSDKVLKDMNRGYDLKTYMGLIERAKKRMPDISLVGDMIVGFPNETHKDFEMSLDLLRQVRFKNVFVFKYSKRPNTIAFKKFFDNVPEEVKKARNNMMLSVQNQIAFEHHKAMVDKIYSVLCEGQAKLDPNSFAMNDNKEINLSGRTTGDHIVHFRGNKDMIGSLMDIKITEARPLSLGGIRV